ncbi:unnamed protein product [Calypogeia fissa]
MAAASPMDVDAQSSASPAAAPAPPPPKFSLNVLQLIKISQAQHGLRHGVDYKRYRRYCTARLMRLYKSLGFKHGRGKYTKKQIVESTVTNVRYLHIVLYLAERAWSYAMEIKEGGNTRQQSHLIRRLGKAAKWANLLNRLCNEKADSRTALEAFAYAEHMRGNLLIERENDWETAVKKLKSARAVYDKLGKIGDVENQVLCRQRVEELDALIKYCTYKLDRSDMRGSDILDLSTPEGPAYDLLQSKLEAVMAEAIIQQAVSMTELEWLGRKWPINNEKTRVCILKGQELEKEISRTDLSSSEKKLSLFDKVFVAYQDAKRHVREDLVVAGNAEDVREQLNGLDRAISSILLQRTVERNQILVMLAKNRLERQQKGLREEKGEKPAKPEDLVRLHDTLIQNVSDLSELVTSGRDQSANEKSFAKKLAAQRLGLQARRCLYLAQSYSAAAKYAEAYSLFHRALEHCESALNSYKRVGAAEEAAVHDLEPLAKDCRVQKCLVHARGVVEASKLDSKVQKGIAALSLSKEPSNKEKSGYLVDRIDVYNSSLEIAQIPPPFQAVPCRPIVLDTAHNFMEFPSLAKRTVKEDKSTGLFSKWFRSK